MAIYESTKVLWRSLSSYSSVFSGTNGLFETSKGSNRVLNFFNGTTVTPISNILYGYFEGYDISGTSSVYGKQDEIYRYSGGTTTRLTNNTFNDYDPQIDGSNTVWYSYDGNDVEIFRNNGTTTTQLTNNTSNDHDLQISGNNTVWVGWDDTDYEIYYNNGTTTTKISNNSTDDYNPLISGNKVVWRNWTGTTERLLYYNGTTTVVAATNVDLPEYDGYKISGDKVVYEDKGRLKLYNGTTKATTVLSTNPIYEFQIDGNRVAWTQPKSTYGIELKLYNGTSTTTIGGDSVSSSQFLLSGNKIAYTDWGNNDYDDRQVFLYDGATTTQVTESVDDIEDIISMSSTDIVWSSYNATYISKPTTKPVLTINNVTVVEGRTSPQSAVIKVTLSKASTTNVTVQYATAESNDYPYAEENEDYTGTVGTLTFTPGQLEKTISVPIINNNDSENDEIFYVQLSNPTGAVTAPGKSKGIVTITDTLQSSGLSRRN